MISFYDELQFHYEEKWNNNANRKTLSKGPMPQLDRNFSILEFTPKASRTCWTYATCGMSVDGFPLELHMFVPFMSDEVVEILTIAAYYHRTTAPLALGHTVNFGRPWISQSLCEYGYVSLPYLDGPLLGEFHSNLLSCTVMCNWLIPITKEERNYKSNNGAEELEILFEKYEFNYLDPYRGSLI